MGWAKSVNYVMSPCPVDRADKMPAVPVAFVVLIGGIHYAVAGLIVGFGALYFQVEVE